MCVALLVLGVGCGQALADDHGPIHWRVTWTTDPATTATVSWDTRSEGEVHRVVLRSESGDDERVVDCQRNGAYTGSGEALPLFYHHARLSELQPATKYFVTIESDGQQVPEMYFITAPAEDRPLALLFGGDSRSGHDARREMNAMLARLVAEQSRAERPTVLALAHGGDYIVDGRVLEQWDRWLTDHQLTVGDDGRMLPVIPTRGNHDVGKIFNEVFDFPPADRNYYAISIGPELRWITLNTETSTAGDQQDWLEEELIANRSSHRWLVAQYHKPAFPAVKVPSGAFPNWVPLFEAHHLDLACEADGHCIKRTPPLRDMKIDPTGVVYIGEGGLGVGQRTPKPGRWYLNSPQAKTGQGHHVHLLTFTGDALTCRAILLEGEVFDEVVLEPRELSRPDAEAVESVEGS